MPVSVAGDRTDDGESRSLALNDWLTGTKLYGDPKGEIAGAQNTTFRLSPEPLFISAALFEEIAALGKPLLAFYHAANRLYAQSVRKIQPDWVREYLELGKDERVIEYGRLGRFKQELPPVIRPDLIPTDAGLIATELDSVPGGMGLLAAITRGYADLGFSPAGGADGMAEGFAWALRRRAKGIADPFVAIVVSDEASDYRPEMEWLGARLNERKLRNAVVHPDDVRYRDDGLYLQPNPAAPPVRVDLVYRFFELFDLPAVSSADLMLFAARKGQAPITPPLKSYLEEKQLFALFHHPALRRYWREQLGEHEAVLRKVLPYTWLFDPRPLPPHAVIPELEIGGGPIRDWSELKSAGKAERELVLKPSGFSAEAWGARGVAIGHDLSASDWGAAIDKGLAAFDRTPHVLQRFHKGAQFVVRHYDFGAGALRTMKGRARLCPYYFTDGEEVRLGGILATIVPLDKKAIHGMVDAVMTPVAVR